jgi:hypothetical protein
VDQRSESRNWKVLDKLKEQNGQQLILLVDWDSVEAFKEPSYKIFTGLTEGSFKATLNMNL